MAITRRHLLAKRRHCRGRPGSRGCHRPPDGEHGPCETATGEPVWRHGLSLFGDVKYPAGFKRFDYVNPDAPKGGVVRQISIGTFDNFNLAVAGVKGTIAPAVGLIYETLTSGSRTRSRLITDCWPRRWPIPTIFRGSNIGCARRRRWHDGKPVTPEDVIFSFDALKKHSPMYASYYRHVVKAEKSASARSPSPSTAPGQPRTADHCRRNHGVAEALVGRHRQRGQKRDISATTLEKPLGSGPYRIKEFVAGPIGRAGAGQGLLGREPAVQYRTNNFDELRSSSSATIGGAGSIQGRSGRLDHGELREAVGDGLRLSGGRGKARRQGRIPGQAISAGCRALCFNLRRDLFKDARVRRAFNYAFDFEEMNKQTVLWAIQAHQQLFRGHGAGVVAACRRGRSWKSSRPCGTRCRRKSSRLPIKIRSAATRKRCVTNLREARGC